jgi:hypothetical protein
MEGIYEPNAAFPFEKMTMISPTVLSGGNYFLKMLVNQGPLYIQMPKSKTKGGIIQSGKRSYCDLLFTNEDEELIQWMEDLEKFACQYIYDHREKWFETEMELTDIENYFASPLKTFRSGKFYLGRANIPQRLGKIHLKIFNEEHQSVEVDTITDKTDMISIVEIQGIKCSARSFQIEMEVKQMMTLETKDLFETCIFGAKTSTQESLAKDSGESIDDNSRSLVDIDTTDNQEQDTVFIQTEPSEMSTLEDFLGESTLENTSGPNGENNITLENNDNDDDDISDTPSLENMEETQPLHLDEMEVDVMNELIADQEVVHIKARNDVYYELYREARKKGQIAKKMALDAYLEANKIKQTYHLESDEDESDEEWMNQIEDSES